ncbi:MAG: hypothetical protein DRI34_03185 [Deltaproteobacteria bacterium]|nr:MAG: hypothetical protein DRI34_03185 [Deltaproteobacteria bacterium]
MTARLPVFTAVTVYGLLLAWPGAAPARQVQVIPVTQNSALTLGTDESYGYQVFPRRPCRIKLVGPGALTVTVRLNHRKKLPILRGRFTIKRGRRRIKSANLKLHRSRVGAYREAPRLHPSLPKVFRIKVPRGLQEYTFSLRAPRGTSLTVGLKYESNADQSAARADESLALAPLVPPGGGKQVAQADGDMPELVPLVPPTPAKTKKASAAKKTATADSDLPELPPLVPTPPAKKPAAKKPKPRPAPVKKPAPRVASHPAAKPVAPPPATQPPAARPATVTKPVPPKARPQPPRQSKVARAGGVRQIDITPPQPPAIGKPAPRRRAPVVSLGIKFGQISPLQKVGGTTYTGSLDIRYIVPVWDGRLSLGVEGGAYRYQLTVTSEQRRLTMLVVPLAVQLFYRIPLHAFLEPYVGAGGDVFLCWGKDEHSETGYSYASTSKVLFGGHLVAGIEAHLGPGYLLGEVRAGISFGDPGIWSNSPNIYGLLAVAGYRFVF